MREHSDWLRVILGYYLEQIFYSAIFFTSNGRTRLQLYRKLYLKTLEIEKKVHILGPTDQNIKLLLYLKCTDNGA